MRPRNRMQYVRIFALLCGAATSTAASWAQEVPASPGATGNGKGQMFHIALVVAENEPGQASQQNLPKGVEKAIADVRDFLPFRSYRIIDSALVRANGRGKALLKGPNGEQYAANLYYRDTDEKGSLLVDQFALVKQEKPSPDAKPLAPGVAPLPPEQPLVSSFRIARGETVVVGSSGLGQGRALIVVLTAMP